jgi:hypothetical protein
LVRVSLLVTVLAVLIAGSLVGSARAGEMIVYSCHTPSGRTVATHGWTTPSWDVYRGPTARDTCSSGATGTLYLNVPGDPLNLHDQAWTLKAAPNTAISRIELAMCIQSRSANSGVRIDYEGGKPPAAPPIYDSGAQPITVGCAGTGGFWRDRRNYMQATGLKANRVFVSAWSQYASARQDAANFYIAGSRADIVDDSAPTVSGVHGPLATNAVHAGSETLTFSAVDAGVGVFRAVAEARLGGAGEWREVASGLVAPSGTCSPLGETSRLYEFAHPQPCPLIAGDSQLTLDHAALGPGQHDLRVFVEDAAGNRTDVIPARPHTVAALVPTVGPPVAGSTINGAGASRSARLRITVPGRPRLRSAGPFRLAGRLVNADSQPITGASLTIRSRPFLPKSGTAIGSWTDAGTVITDAKGVFRARMRSGASRMLQVSYRHDLMEPEPAAIALTKVVVPARVQIRSLRSRVRNGRSAVFRGQVAGPIPRGGVLVALEVRQRGRWISVPTARRWVRTTRAGRFTLSYRFMNTFSPSVYRFRAVAGEDSAFQYARGVSRTVAVRVRP